MKNIRVETHRLYGLLDCTSGFSCSINEFLALLSYLDDNKEVLRKGVYGIHRNALLPAYAGTKVIRTSFNRDKVYTLCKGLGYKRSVEDTYRSTKINVHKYNDLVTIANELNIAPSLVCMYLDVISPNLNCVPLSETPAYPKAHSNSAKKLKVKRPRKNIRHSPSTYANPNGAVLRAYSNRSELSLAQLIHGYLAGVLRDDDYDILIASIMHKCGISPNEAMQCFINMEFPAAITTEAYVVPPASVNIPSYGVTRQFVIAFCKKGLVDLAYDMLDNLALTEDVRLFTVELTLSIVDAMQGLWEHSTRKTQIEFLTDVACLDYFDEDDLHSSDVQHSDGLDSTHLVSDEEVYLAFTEDVDMLLGEIDAYTN